MAIRLYRARIQGFTPDPDAVRVYRARVTATVPVFNTIRIYKASLISEVRADFIRRGGEWVHIKLFARKNGGWK